MGVCIPTRSSTSLSAASSPEPVGVTWYFRRCGHEGESMKPTEYEHHVADVLQAVGQHYRLAATTNRRIQTIKRGSWGRVHCAPTC